MVRGTGRGGRGMGVRGGMGRPPFNRPRVMMLRPPFDLILAEPAFPRCKPAPDDSALTQVRFDLSVALLHSSTFFDRFRVHLQKNHGES